MKDTYYLKWDLNTFEDLSIKALRKNYGMRGFGSFVCVIIIMRNAGGIHLEYSEFVWEALAEDLQWTAVEVKQFIDDCIDKFHLLKKEDGYFFSERLNRDVAFLEESREKKVKAGKISAEKKYGKPVNDLARMTTLYEEKVGKPLATAKDAELIKDIANTYPFEQFEKAVDEAVQKKARTLSYIAKILENWQKKAEPARRSYSDDGADGMTEGD